VEIDGVSLTGETRAEFSVALHNDQPTFARPPTFRTFERPQRAPAHAGPQMMEIFMPRRSTKGPMIDSLVALDDRARYAADFSRGVAHGLMAAGANSDHVQAALNTDGGVWVIDDDGRRVWRRTP
jgi:hypothetical protein